MTQSPVLTKPYVEQRESGYWIGKTRISLDSIVYLFLQGESPESIAQNFPLISLEQIYGAIAFYLLNQALIDSYLKEGEDEFEQLKQRCRETNPLLYQKLQAAKSDSV